MIPISQQKKILSHCLEQYPYQELYDAFFVAKDLLEKYGKSVYDEAIRNSITAQSEIVWVVLEVCNTYGRPDRKQIMSYIRILEDQFHNAHKVIWSDQILTTLDAGLVKEIVPWLWLEYIHGTDIYKRSLDKDLEKISLTK